MGFLQAGYNWILFSFTQSHKPLPFNLVFGSFTFNVIFGLLKLKLNLKSSLCSLYLLSSLLSIFPFISILAYHNKYDLGCVIAVNPFGFYPVHFYLILVRPQAITIHTIKIIWQYKTIYLFLSSVLLVLYTLLIHSSPTMYCYYFLTIIY